MASAVPQPGETVAGELRQARQALGRNVAQVAADLKIRRVYLQAIEEGRFDDLPGATYAVGFVRAYSEYLGLDSVEVVGRFKQEVDGLNERMRLVFPTPVPESKIPSGAVILISVVLVAFAYGGWYYFTSRDVEVAGEVPDVPKSLESLVSEPTGEGGERSSSGAGTKTKNLTTGSTQVAVLTLAEPTLATGSERAEETAVGEDTAEGAGTANAEEGADAAADEAPAGSESAGTDEALPAEESEDREAVQANEAGVAPEATEAAETAEVGEAASGAAAEAQAPLSDLGEPRTVAAAPLPGAAGNLGLNGTIPAAPETEALLPDDESREPRVYGVENGAARIVLRARLDSWVQVRDQEDSLLLTRVLQPGDSYRVPDQEGLTLLTGNAGGLEIEVDGNTVPPLGPVGAVRRDIALDPARLLAGTADNR